MSGIYVASKAKYGYMWLNYRDNENVPIISTWINEYKSGDTSDFSNLWLRCINEASSCSLLVLYAQPNDLLKGALVEVGAALAHDIPVILVGENTAWRTFHHHPLVTKEDSLDKTFNLR